MKRHRPGMGNWIKERTDRMTIHCRGPLNVEKQHQECPTNKKKSPISSPLVILLAVNNDSTFASSFTKQNKQGTETGMCR